MAKDWDLIREMLPKFAKGDVAYVYYSKGIICRGPVKAFSITEGGNRINITFWWLASMVGDGSIREEWISERNQTISMSKDMLLSATMGENYQLEFATQMMSGTFYPAGQNLKPPRVKEPASRPHLRRVK